VDVVNGRIDRRKADIPTKEVKAPRPMFEPRVPIPRCPSFPYCAMFPRPPPLNAPPDYQPELATPDYLSGKVRDASAGIPGSRDSAEGIDAHRPEPALACHAMSTAHNQHVDAGRRDGCC
jgi:hypothetical protein